VVDQLRQQGLQGLAKFLAAPLAQNYPSRQESLHPRIQDLLWFPVPVEQYEVFFGDSIASHRTV